MLPKLRTTNRGKLFLKLRVNNLGYFHLKKEQMSTYFKNDLEEIPSMHGNRGQFFPLVQNGAFFYRTPS